MELKIPSKEPLEMVRNKSLDSTEKMELLQSDGDEESISSQFQEIEMEQSPQDPIRGRTSPKSSNDAEFQK